MNDLSSPLGRIVGPEGNPNSINRRAKVLWQSGNGALLFRHHLEALSPAARAEVEAQMITTYGSRERARINDGKTT